MLVLGLLAIVAILSSVTSLPLHLARREGDVTVCGIAVKRSSASYNKVCESKPGYMYQNQDFGNAVGKLSKKKTPWPGNVPKGSGLLECDHLVEAQWLARMIEAKYPNSKILKNQKVSANAGAFCKAMRDDNDGEALKRVLNEGNNMWGVPTGVDQLKAKVTNNPEFEEWDMQVYSRNNFNKARKGVMQYMNGHKADAQGVAGELYDVLTTYDDANFPSSKGQLLSDASINKEKKAWLENLANIYTTMNSHLGSRRVANKINEACKGGNPAGSADLKKVYDAKKQEEKDAKKVKAEAKATGKKTPGAKMRKGTAKQAAIGASTRRGVAVRAWHAAVVWTRALLAPQASGAHLAAAEEDEEDPDECPSDEGALVDDPAPSSSLTAVSLSASSSTLTGTATASSGSSTRSIGASSVVGSGSATSTGAVPTRSHPATRLGSSADLDADTAALASSTLRPTASGNRASLSSRPLAPTASARLGADVPSLQLTRSALRATGAAPLPTGPAGSPLRNPAQPALAHSLVVPGTAARPTSLSPAPSLQRPGSSGGAPSAQVKPVPAAVAPLPTKPLSKPSVALPPSRSSGRGGRRISRDLGRL